MDESPTREELIKEARKIANEAQKTVQFESGGAIAGGSVLRAVKQLSIAIKTLADAMEAN